MSERWREILRDLKHGIAQQDDTTPLWKACKRIAALEAEVTRLRSAEGDDPPVPIRHAKKVLFTGNDILRDGIRLGLEAAAAKCGTEKRKAILALRPEDIAKEAR